MCTPTTRREPNLAAQPPLFAVDATTATSGRSATHTSISGEDAYLCAWLRSRLELTTRTLREESALTHTPSDRRQIWRLLQQVRARGLDLTLGARVFGKAA